MSEQGATVNLNDFATVINLIDICTERGAFKGNELLAIGQLRQKFANFVDANAEKANEASENQPVADEEEETED